MRHRKLFVGLVIGAVLGTATRGLAQTATGQQIISGRTLSMTPAGVSAITVTASPFTYTNADGVQEAIYISGGTVSAITKNAIAIFSASPATVWLGPGESVTVTYTGLPTMNKDQK